MFPISTTDSLSPFLKRSSVSLLMIPGVNSDERYECMIFFVCAHCFKGVQNTEYRSCAEECGSPTQSGSYRLPEICGSESVAWKQNPSSRHSAQEIRNLTARDSASAQGPTNRRRAVRCRPPWRERRTQRRHASAWKGSVVTCRAPLGGWHHTVTPC